jgi:hypothetical protein
VIDVALIHIGAPTPAYMRTCIRQVKEVAGRSPLVVGTREARRMRSPKLKRFREHESLSDMGLAGFWRFSCERFFVLEQALRAAGLDRALHIENDNLLYAAPAEYEDWLAETYGAGLAICPLTVDEDTAGAMYVGSLAALAAFNDALLELVALPPAELLARHGGPMANEMRMIQLLRTEHGLAEALPTTVASAVERSSPVVFDPASYGQWVDGIPSAPGVSYAGDHHFIGADIIAGNLRVSWDSQQRIPSVLSRRDDRELPLANLHIHSKRLERWTTEVHPPAPPGPPGLVERGTAVGRMVRRRVARPRTR